MSNNYGQWVDVLYEEPTGWGILSGIYHVAGGVIGYNTFWLLILPMPIIVTWLMQKSTVIPITLYLVLGTMFALAGTSELQKPAFIMLVFGITGLTYHLFKNRR